ncbi:CcdB family protein [Sphingomonas bacterium]|uniref:CcdB family protein n=1 Tax=Sphingomonas bacterium TaxID=1895847 RepID=UPI001576D6D9|nr:CcdB family protein [Sphingomonas bacterium]
MAQFDVYRLRGGGLVLDCQSDLLDALPSRFVVPLRASHPAELKHLTLMFDVEGKRLIMLTPLARSVDRRDIESTIATLANEQDQIKRALDMLVSGI